jgi:hypothetical protein
MSTWIVTYDDGDALLTAEVSGKLSLDVSWLFVIDPNRPQPTIVLAVPTARVVDVKELG